MLEEVKQDFDNLLNGYVNESFDKDKFKLFLANSFRNLLFRVDRSLYNKLSKLNEEDITNSHKFFEYAFKRYMEYNQTLFHKMHGVCVNLRRCGFKPTEGFFEKEILDMEDE